MKLFFQDFWRGKLKRAGVSVEFALRWSFATFYSAILRNSRDLQQEVSWAWKPYARLYCAFCYGYQGKKYIFERVILTRQKNIKFFKAWEKNIYSWSKKQRSTRRLVFKNAKTRPYLLNLRRTRFQNYHEMQISSIPRRSFNNFQIWLSNWGNFFFKRRRFKVWKTGKNWAAENVEARSAYEF